MISDAQNTKRIREEEESNSMTSTQNTQEILDEKTYIVQHTRERIYNQKRNGLLHRSTG